MNLNAMLEQAKQKANELKADMAKKQYSGSAGAGMVNATVNGAKILQELTIEPELLAQDKAVLESMIISAVNAAISKAEAESSGAALDLAKAFAGSKLPF